MAAAAAKSLQSCPTQGDSIDCSPPGSAVPGSLQARTLEWVAIAFSNAWKWKVKVKSLSRLTLHDPMDYSLPGSSIHRIFQARVLERVAIAFSANHARKPQTLGLNMKKKKVSESILWDNYYNYYNRKVFHERMHLLALWVFFFNYFFFFFFFKVFILIAG